MCVGGGGLRARLTILQEATAWLWVIVATAELPQHLVSFGAGAGASAGAGRICTDRGYISDTSVNLPAVVGAMLFIVSQLRVFKGIDPTRPRHRSTKLPISNTDGSFLPS